MVLLDVPVAALVKDHLVAGSLEHLSLLLKDDVLASRLLIGVMNEKYFHQAKFPFLVEPRVVCVEQQAPDCSTR